MVDNETIGAAVKLPVEAVRPLMLPADIPVVGEGRFADEPLGRGAGDRRQRDIGEMGTGRA